MIAVYDPSGKLGLTDPSPGGGTVPRMVKTPSYGWRSAEELANETRVYAGEPCTGLEWADMHSWPDALLVTEDGTPDPVGMARAREVLARVLEMDGVDHGVLFAPRGPDRWSLEGRPNRWIIESHYDVHVFDALPGETAPEALARLLAEHAGCEVIRG